MTFQKNNIRKSNNKITILKNKKVMVCKVSKYFLDLITYLKLR